MAGKKTIVIKKPKAVKVQPISVYSERKDEVPQLRTRQLKGPPKTAATKKTVVKRKTEPAEKPASFKFYCIRCGQKLPQRPTGWAKRSLAPRAATRSSFPSRWKSSRPFTRYGISDL